MDQASGRIQCPHCQANNFSSSDLCWQCGQPLRAQQDQPPPETPAGPMSPTQQQEPVQPPPGGPQPPPRAAEDTNIYIILGFVFAALGLFCCCCPPLFAIPAIVLGTIAYSKGDRRGLWVIIAGVAALLAGGTLTYAVRPYRRWSPYVPPQLPGPWHGV